MSNTDRETLEWAAKAYADANVHFDGLSFVRFIGRNEELGCNVMVAWNPLLDDGDALRLAVKLNLHINIDFDLPKHEVRVFGEDAEAAEKGDPYAATRRAIVRAAAEIGKAMSHA